MLLKIHVMFWGAKKGFTLWTDTIVQRCLYPLFKNQSPLPNHSPPYTHFLLSSLFWNLSQPLDQDQQNSKQAYCLLLIIFLWTLKSFISPGFFLNFLLNLYISPWLSKSFKFIILIKITANTFVSHKIESVQFYSWPQAKLFPRFFIIIPQADIDCPFFPNSIFWR